LDGDRAATVLHIAGIAADRDVIALEQFLQTQMGLAGVPDPESIGVFPDGVECHKSRPLALTQLLIAYHLLRFRPSDAPEAVELTAV